MEPYAEVVTQYADFAEHAAQESPCFAAWSRGVVADPEVVAWIAGLPPLKQQPNLVFAAARWHGVPAPGPYDGLRTALLGDTGAIRATVAGRSTQTNEVGRLATLVPALVELAQGEPLALVEVGASAGLCLYPDRWGYAWDAPTGPVTLGPEPRLACEVSGGATLPTGLPTVAWRAGLDLHPLDVTDPDAVAWLENLVWPEQDERRRRLARAVEVARADPPYLRRGDLLEDLPALLDEAAGHGRVVVMHSAVLAYVDPEGRRRFHRQMTERVAAGTCHWVSNEAPQVLPEITATAAQPPPGGPTFVLGVDGRARAWTHGHGRWLHALG